MTSQLVVHYCNHRFQAKDGEKNHHENIDRNILTYNEKDPPSSFSTSDCGNIHGNGKTIPSSLAHNFRINMNLIMNLINIEILIIENDNVMYCKCHWGTEQYSITKLQYLINPLVLYAS